MRRALSKLCVSASADEDSIRARPTSQLESASQAKVASDILPAYTDHNMSISSWEKAGNDPTATTIDSLSSVLRELSLSIWNEPELAWHEYKSHDKLVAFMQKRGFKVTPHAYGLETAFEAVYQQGSGGQTVGFNSEYDALPGIGQACGHNLIAIGGVGSAIACAEALKNTNTAGKVILLGTPAEEKDGGKIKLLQAGAYQAMNACLMIHPAAKSSEGLGHMLAISEIEVEFHGHGAHAAGAPWEGINALDAAVNVYNAISQLRQQTRPEYRLHCIIQMREDVVVNVIPDYTKVSVAARCPTLKELEELKAKITNIIDAAALSTGCKAEKKWLFTYNDVVQNSVLGSAYTDYVKANFDISLPKQPSGFASTDFGNITYTLPALHPIYAIPTSGPSSGNHTPEFTKAAKTEEAHVETLKAMKGISAVAWRILSDADYAKQVKDSFHV